LSLTVPHNKLECLSPVMLLLSSLTLIDKASALSLEWGTVGQVGFSFTQKVDLKNLPGTNILAYNIANLRL